MRAARDSRLRRVPPGGFAIGLLAGRRGHDHPAGIKSRNLADDRLDATVARGGVGDVSAGVARPPQPDPSDVALRLPATQWIAFIRSVVWSSGSTTSRISLTSAVNRGPERPAGAGGPGPSGRHCSPPSIVESHREISGPANAIASARRSFATPPHPWQMMIVGSFLPSEDFGEKTSADMRVLR